MVGSIFVLIRSRLPVKCRLRPFYLFTSKRGYYQGASDKNCLKCIFLINYYITKHVLFKFLDMPRLINTITAVKSCHVFVTVRIYFFLSNIHFAIDCKITIGSITNHMNDESVTCIKMQDLFVFELAYVITIAMTLKIHI